MFDKLVSTIHKYDKSVALVTLAFNPQLYYRKMFHALWQLYPHHLKTLMLLYQPDPATGKFPSPIAHDMPFSIIQENVNYQWPEAWAFKWKRAIDIAIERKIDIMVVYDEDDEYPPWWMEMMVQRMVDKNADGCWSWFNIDAKRASILGYAEPKPYDAPSGTLVAYTRVLKVAIDKLFVKYPLGKRHAEADGTTDLTFSLTLAREFKIISVMLTQGDNRGYFRYGLANTKKRNHEDDIDFGFAYSKYLTAKRPSDEPARIALAHVKRAKLIHGKKTGGKQIRGTQLRSRRKKV